MIENDEIFIGTEFNKGKDFQESNTIKGQTNYKNNKNSNEIKKLVNNNIEKNLKENKENIKFKKIYETEKIKLNINENDNISNNSNLFNQFSSLEQQEKDTENNFEKKENNTIKRNFLNINDNISTNLTKEETVQQNQEKNKQNFNYNSLKSDNSKIIEQNEDKNIKMEENKTIESILQPINKIYINQRNKKNNVQNVNKLYFTDTNIIGTKTNNNLHKSKSNNLYTISLSPINSNISPKFLKVESPIQSHIELKDKSIKKNKKMINFKLNNLSPKQYMKKRVINNFNFQPFQYKIKILEEQMQKQNKYDFEQAMKDMKMEYDKKLKSKEKEKRIIKENQKLKEKLKNMEEYRNNLLNQKLQKLIEKENNSKNEVKINLYKNRERNSMHNLKSRINRNTIIGKIMNTINFNSVINEKEKKLPSIQSVPKYQIIKKIKEKKEEDFCFDTEKKLKENEKNHRKNYLRHLKQLNNRLKKKNKLYEQRIKRCLKSQQYIEEELKEDYIEKDIKRRYNINQNILRENSAKNEKYKENLIRNLEGIKEKKEMIEKEEDQKIKKYINKLNREIKKESSYDYQISQRNYFSDLQKKNLTKCNKDNNKFYSRLIYKNKENFMIINEIEKEEPLIKQTIIKRTIKEQNKKNEKILSLNKYLGYMESANINYQTDEVRNKFFQEKRKIEIAKKRKEEEELEKK